ncbi:DinB family protein [Gracilimonas sp.]|uniref:DinB family protein n=1 Tax=Gracilimonas sp. TaxID=1974203 RepID=UPI0032EE234A
MTKDNSTSLIITPDQLLEHWQGHRSLTRRVIEAFPDDKLFTHSIGGMRPFSELALEMIKMASPGISGIASGKWEEFGDFSGDDISLEVNTKEELLKLWDWSTEQINKIWSSIPEGRFQEKDVAFGQWEGQTWWHMFYFIDNEIHHRGQGYVYLRSLGIEPPFFWER